MTAFESGYDFQEAFTCEVASALIEGLRPRFHPKGVETIVMRMRNDISKGLLKEIDGVIAREEISRWLEASDLPSEYQFGKYPIHDVLPIDAAIDPSDLPSELDAANMAFRAVTKGYGDPSETPRNRLVQYLKKHHKDFTSAQVDRIATVANPDKTTGRKISGKE